eukprot:COSAG03_NODE_2048_length_3185_cov_42.169151_3_plen_182_part_00
MVRSQEPAAAQVPGSCASTWQHKTEASLSLSLAYSLALPLEGLELGLAHARCGDVVVVTILESESFTVALEVRVEVTVRCRSDDASGNAVCELRLQEQRTSGKSTIQVNGGSTATAEASSHRVANGVLLPNGMALSFDQAQDITKSLETAFNKCLFMPFLSVRGGTLLQMCGLVSPARAAA